MPQVQRTANDLILGGYYLIGLISPNEQPTSYQLNNGLELLNDMLDSFSGSPTTLIPYVTTFDITLTPGKDIYSISTNITNPDVTQNQIASLEFVSIILSSVSYPVKIIERAELFNNTHVTTLQTRPGVVILDRQENVSYIQLYPAPDQAYVCRIRTKSYLDSLELQQDLNQIPRFYYKFLRYALGRELRSIYPSSNWPDTTEQEYQRLFKLVTSAGDINLVIEPSNILMQAYDYNDSSLFGDLV